MSKPMIFSTRMARRRYREASLSRLELSGFLDEADLSTQPCERVVAPVHDALLQRDDPVVGEIDVLGTNLAATGGDVAEAKAKVILQLVPPVGSVERMHLEHRVADQESGAD